MPDVTRRGRRVRWLGYVPPRSATQVRTCACGVEWRPAAEEVRRWELGDRVLWIATCPECSTTVTVADQAGRDAHA